MAVYDVINTFGVGVDLSHISTHVKLEIHPGDLKDKEKSNQELTKALTVRKENFQFTHLKINFFLF